MRILHISDYFNTKLWYQEVFLAKEEVKNWDHVFVVASNRNYPYPNYEDSYQKLLWERNMKPWISKEEWIEIHKSKTLFELPSSAFIIYLWILKYIRKIKPDIICCHDLIKPNNIRAYIYKIFFNKNVKIVIDTHEAEYNTKIDTFVKKVYLSFRRLIFRPLIVGFSNKIVATGPSEKKFALKNFLKKNTKIDIVPLWADIERFRPNDDVRANMRKKYEILDNEIVLINAWKINEGKKNKELLEAFIKINKEIDNLRLFFIWNWDRDYIDNIKNIVKNESIENKVVFIDFVENDKLPDYLNMADIWVWPGSPSNIFFEAMSCGLPIILQRREHAEALVANGNGILLDNWSPKEILDALHTLIRQNLKKVWENSREIIERKFSWNIINKSFLLL